MGEALAAVQDEALQRAANGIDDGSTLWFALLVLAVIGLTVIGSVWVWRKREDEPASMGRRNTDSNFWELVESQRSAVKILEGLESRTAKLQEMLAETRLLLDAIERRMEQHNRDADQKLNDIMSRCLQHGANLRAR